MMVSFIILNYKRSDLTRRCVSSIEQFLGSVQKEIIVVDNGSGTEALKKLEVLRGQCTLIECRQNGGFGCGNNRGAEAAHGNYLCFVNSDVTFSHDCISPLVDYMQEHSEVGVITPQQLNSEGKPVATFKHTPGLRHELLGDGLFERMQPQKYPRRKQYDRTEPFCVSQICGPLMLFDAQKFWNIGAFDTNIFLYYEEYDICRRLRMHGYTCVVYPTLTYHHIHGGSTTPSHQTTRELHISKLYTYRKHHNRMMSSLFQLVNLMQILRKPYKWYLLPVVTTGEYLSHSMRHKK
ncbi:MAG: glycosyltransferase family 2 protein [Bacteroidaceae bacterium]|nr:glycosyltransferase family 2 protein [Bacteroidaceae bacterium]